MSRTSILGGESASRGWFGGTASTTRIISLAVAAGIGMILMITNAYLGVGVGLVLAGVAWLLTMDTDNGTILSRAIANHRWSRRVKEGTVTFVPFIQSEWDNLCAALAMERGKSRRAMYRQLAAMRETPDGVEGMSWLEDRTGEPGIAWHRPTGEQPYLSVTFAVDGQVSGIESNGFLDGCSEAYGNMLARNGDRSSQVSGIQTTVRVLPMDAAHHAQWIVDHIDKGVPRVLAESYNELINILAAGNPVERHFVTFSWAISPRFVWKARRRGDGKAGWLKLMSEEIRGAEASLRNARYKGVQVLTARRTAAVLRHMQHPAFAIDSVKDLSPNDCWVPSHDERTHTTYAAALGPQRTVTASLTATARIDPSKVETAERDSLWLSNVLMGMPRQVVRTISFHLEVIPQAEARSRARRDVTSDMADRAKAVESGRLADDEIDVTIAAAQRRRADLLPGRGHHGLAWVGYVSVSAGSKPELIEAIEAIEEACSTVGITELGWLDTYQSAAAACAWPVGRGIKPSKRSGSSRIRELAAGNGKDQL